MLALFATSPLWLGAVGLYQYLALEVLIWSLYALGYNLLLGYGGLPSFGHGAFFGVGAYAAGLALKQADVAWSQEWQPQLLPLQFLARSLRRSFRIGAASTTH